MSGDGDGSLCWQLFKGMFYFCDGNGADLSDVINKTDCINKGPPYRWVNRKYNFDDLGQVSSAALVFGVLYQ